MRSGWSWAIPVASFLVASITAAGHAEESTLAMDAPIVVGDVSNLDLLRVRELSETTDLETASVRAVETAVEEARLIGLQVAVELALVHNPDLQIARYERDAAVHEVPAARARFHPTTGFAVGAEGSDLAGDSERGTAQAFVRQELPTGGAFTASGDLLRTDVSGESLRNEGAIGVELRQPLMRGGRTFVARRDILDAGYALTIEDAQFEARVLEITRDTKVAYFNSILAARLIDVTAAAVERDRRLIEASEALFQAARASRRDLVSAQIRLSDDLAQLAGRRAELRQSQLELRDVIGLPLHEVVTPAESSVPFQPVAFREPEWVDSALERRPEIRQLEAQLEREELSLRISHHEVLPKLDLLGLYRRRDDDGALASAFDLGGEDWGVGLEFEIPFANVAARERLVSARLRYARVGRELARQRRAVEREVRDQVIELRRNLAEVAFQADKVERSREKLEIAVARYGQGIANNLDITDAQEDLLDAETDLLTAIFDYTNGLARLEASIAGPV
jgi:outer membrane protein TolC